jgi:fructose-1,6-bisphosphatase/inositol monophosphatase family enzyme
MAFSAKSAFMVDGQRFALLIVFKRQLSPCFRQLAGQAVAGLAFEYYQQREALTVDHKGDDLQDVVSVADKRVEAPCFRQLAGQAVAGL